MILKQRIKDRLRFPSTVAEMRAAVQEEWDKLQPAQLNKHIDEMPARTAQVHERKGMQTMYYYMYIQAFLFTFILFIVELKLVVVVVEMSTEIAVGKCVAGGRCGVSIFFRP